MGGDSKHKNSYLVSHFLLNPNYFENNFLRIYPSLHPPRQRKNQF